MIKLETVEFLRGLIAFVIAYFPTVTFAGYFETWIAKKFGDYTAYEAGYLTFNPLIHMDPLGLAIIVLSPHFGFGARIPMNPNNVQGRLKSFKIALLFFSRAIAHFILLILSLAALIFLHLKFAGFFIYSKPSPLVLTLFLIFQALLSLNIISVMLYVIMGLLRNLIHFFLPDLELRSGFMSLAIFLLPFLMIIVLGPYIQEILINFSASILGPWIEGWLRAFLF